MYFATPVSKMRKKDAHIFFLSQCFYLATPHIPSGWMPCLSLHNFLCLFEFSGKRTMRWKGFLSKDRDPTPDCRCTLHACLFSSWAVWRLFFFPKKKTKTEGNCAPYGGLGENVPVTHLCVCILLVSLVRVFPRFLLVQRSLSHVVRMCRTLLVTARTIWHV